MYLRIGVEHHQCVGFDMEVLVVKHDVGRAACTEEATYLQRIGIILILHARLHECNQFFRLHCYKIAQYTCAK